MTFIDRLSRMRRSDRGECAQHRVLQGAGKYESPKLVVKTSHNLFHLLRNISVVIIIIIISS